MNTTYRKPEATRVTPHQVASIASKLRPADAKVLYALKNQMIDDIRARVELVEALEKAYSVGMDINKPHYDARKQMLDIVAAALARVKK